MAINFVVTDLTFIEDSNSDNFSDNDYINFIKRQKASQVISEIQQYQNTPYCLEGVSFIKDYLTTVESLDENTCYKMSLEREERGATTAKRPNRSNTKAVRTEVSCAFLFFQLWSSCGRRCGGACERTEEPHASNGSGGV